MISFLFLLYVYFSQNLNQLYFTESTVLADKARDLLLESDPAAASVVIGFETNANYCCGVFIWRDLDA